MKSITFGKRLVEMERKENFPGCPGKMVGVHGAGIGCYERDEVKPSIEMATQIAQALNVSLD